MKYKTIPNTDLKVSVICLGTMTFGLQNTEEEAHAQLDYAVSKGINFIDTAEIYPVPPTKELQGDTEIIVGNWLAKRGNRKDLIIATKVAADSNLIRTRDTGEVAKYDRKSIREAIEGSLKRLQTDYIDLYQIHWPERKTNFFGTRGYHFNDTDYSTEIKETLEVLTELVKEGKVRYIGVSNETPWGISEYIRLSKENNLARIVTIQNQYSLVNRTFEIGLAEMCIKENVGLLPYSVLSMGALTGKYLNGAKPEGARFTFNKRNSERYNPENAQDAYKAYLDLAKKHNIDPATMAIAFSLAQPCTTSAIIGASKMEQLKNNIEAESFIISPEIMSDIQALYKKYPDPVC